MLHEIRFSSSNSLSRDCMGYVSQDKGGDTITQKVIDNILGGE